MVGLALSCCGEYDACFFANADRDRQQPRERRQRTSAPPAVGAGVCALLFVCTLLRYYCMQYVLFNCAQRRRHFPVSSTAPKPRNCFETPHYMTQSDLHQTSSMESLVAYNRLSNFRLYYNTVFLTIHIPEYPPKRKMGFRFRRR